MIPGGILSLHGCVSWELGIRSELWTSRNPAREETQLEKKERETSFEGILKFFLFLFGINNLFLMSFTLSKK